MTAVAAGPAALPCRSRGAPGRRRAARWLAALLLVAVALVPGAGAQETRVLRVGSKTFAESYVLAEIAAQLLESAGFTVRRQPGLGGTLVAYESLRTGELDLYPEYTGTLVRAVLKRPGIGVEALQAALAEQGLALRAELGFRNSYALAIREELAAARGIARISDLARHPDLRLGFSLEFLSRGDGWPALRALYGLPQEAEGMEHALAYRALGSGALDVTDAYTTDGEVDLYPLRLLEDDRGLFPDYSAWLLTRADLDPEAARVLARLSGRIDEAAMRAMNRRVVDDGEDPAAVAAAFLRRSALVSEATAPRRGNRILHNTLVHLKLTGLALGLGCLLAIPLALALARFPRVSRGLQYAAGLVQTIPALALLALLIPLFGLGEVTAVTALFLYSLLPIVRNTLTGMLTIDPLLREVAQSLGLTPLQQLWRIELPLALPTIVAGIKTAAIISIGTATLAAFVGAGGLGEPIITGLTLTDNRLILEGAIPAALLAIAAELLFELLERALLPAHLRRR